MSIPRSLFGVMAALLAVGALGCSDLTRPDPITIAPEPVAAPAAAPAPAPAPAPLPGLGAPAPAHTG